MTSPATVGSSRRSLNRACGPSRAVAPRRRSDAPDQDAVRYRHEYLLDPLLRADEKRRVNCCAALMRLRMVVKLCSTSAHRTWSEDCRDRFSYIVRRVAAAGPPKVRRCPVLETVVLGKNRSPAKSPAHYLRSLRNTVSEMAISWPAGTRRQDGGASAPKASATSAREMPSSRALLIKVCR